jgi:catechol 2,3-dioxygenase-like lactoylglutathione lyase family enzyme
MKIKHIDHIGINVDNLEAAKVFFTDLGFRVVGEMVMQGELVDRVTGLKDVKDDLVMCSQPRAIPSACVISALMLKT